MVWQLNAELQAGNFAVWFIHFFINSSRCRKTRDPHPYNFKDVSERFIAFILQSWVLIECLVPALKTRQFLTSNKRQIVLKILLSISLYRIKNGQDYSIRFILSLSIMLIFETDRPFQTKVAAGKRLTPLSPPSSANQLRQWRFVWHI